MKRRIRKTVTTVKIPQYRRLRVGTLADGRQAFAVQSCIPSEKGLYHCATVYVRNRQAYCGSKLLRDVSFTTPRSRSYREAFGMIVKGTEKRIKRTFPAYIAHTLGWWKSPEDKAADRKARRAGRRP